MRNREPITLKHRWLKLCESAALDGEEQWHTIESNHEAADRAYHKLSHIRDCLDQLDASLELASNALSLEFAIWFHDLIYDAKAADNEQRSAEAAASFLSPLDIADQVTALILATRHDGDQQDGDAKLICDIDLSILGRDPLTYRDYAASIRKEYAWVGEEEYREGRSRVLKQFLKRKQIYCLPSFHKRYEDQARLNIQTEIEHLQ